MKATYIRWLQFKITYYTWSLRSKEMLLRKTGVYFAAESNGSGQMTNSTTTVASEIL